VSENEERRPRRRVGETEVVRWFCYAGFAVCSVVLVVALTFNVRWFPALVGVVIWGVPTLVMYRQEQARRENMQVVREHRTKSAGGGRRFFEDEDGS
jgi:type IV secretory pathway TrbD component